jgi:hypothetical protein
VGRKTAFFYKGSSRGMSSKEETTMYITLGMARKRFFINTKQSLYPAMANPVHGPLGGGGVCNSQFLYIMVLKRAIFSHNSIFPSVMNMWGMKR